MTYSLNSACTTKTKVPKLCSGDEIKDEPSESEADDKWHVQNVKSV